MASKSTKATKLKDNFIHNRYGNFVENIIDLIGKKAFSGSTLESFSDEQTPANHRNNSALSLYAAKCSCNVILRAFYFISGDD